MAGNNPEVRVQVHLEGIEEAQEALRGLNEKIAAVKALAGELAAAMERIKLDLYVNEDEKGIQADELLSYDVCVDRLHTGQTAGNEKALELCINVSEKSDDVDAFDERPWRN